MRRSKVRRYPGGRWKEDPLRELDGSGPTATQGCRRQLGDEQGGIARTRLRPSTLEIEADKCWTAHIGMMCDVLSDL